ncbi:MAG: glycoside hydrolase family 3 C-terminal domain-containing protein, partial [Bacillota bacterium]
RDRQLVNAINEGKTPFAPLDKSVERILRYVFSAEENRKKYKSFKADYAEHHHLARQAAAGGAVLMKNEGNILPLSSGTSFAVVGELAKKIRSQGSGSSKLNPINEVSFTQYLKKLDIDFSYSAGYNVNTDVAEVSKIDRAVVATKDKDVVIAFVGLTEAYESEAFDRTHINLPDSHNKMIDKLCQNHDKVIVVLVGGSPVAMPWLNKVSAVLNVYLTGEAGGEATYDLLFGKKNPSGHLAETYPLCIEDIPSTPYFCKEVVPYCESIFVGYRYFDTAKKEVLFPFGYGLSYTKFEYSNIKLSANKIQDNDKLIVSFEVKNIGDVSGEAVPQLYVKDTQSSIYVPEKQLKGFDKIMLKAGEKKKVKIDLNKRSFAYYNTDVCDFAVEAGEFEILVGEHSRDIRLTAKVEYKASALQIPNYSLKAPSYYNVSEGGGFPIAEFEVLLGRKVPVYHRPHKGEYGFNTVVGELDATWFAKLFRWIFKQSSLSMIPKNASTATKKMTQRGAMDMPIRNFYAMSGGTVSYEACTALLEAFNGKVVRGLFFTVIYLLKKSYSSKESIYKEKSNAKDKSDSSDK